MVKRYPQAMDCTDARGYPAVIARHTRRPECGPDN